MWNIRGAVEASSKIEDMSWSTCGSVGYSDNEWRIGQRASRRQPLSVDIFMYIQIL